jgi:hypothetical protein
MDSHSRGTPTIKWGLGFHVSFDMAQVGIGLGAALGKEIVFAGAFKTVPGRQNAQYTWSPG